MDITITPGALCGTVPAIPSKSVAHRLLICAAFADAPTTLVCPDINRDIQATADCLCALGAQIRRTETGFEIAPVAEIPKQAVLSCAEGGSTPRFLLPVAGALGVDTTFRMEGRLAARPLSPLWEEMERMGCRLSRPTADTLRCTGKLHPGEYTIAGNISSQFITGLLFACSLIPGASHISVTGKLESKPYLDMTVDALAQFGLTCKDLSINGGQQLHSPGALAVEGDWSNAAFFLGARTVGNPVAVTGLNPLSHQGDRAVTDILLHLESFCNVDATDIPDLVPILSVVAACRKGCVFTGIRRLRLKESDRVASVIGMLRSLGIRAEFTENTLSVHPGAFTGGLVDSVNDHRIAMAAAIAATVSTGPVTILNAQCVNKSYPAFWAEFSRLGGHYEQYIR